MIAALTENLYKAAKEVKQKRVIKSLPILSHIHIKLDDCYIKFETTNLDTPLKSKTACRQDHGDSLDTCVPMKPFTDWLRVTEKMADVVYLEFDPRVNILHITGQNFKTEFKCIDSQEFPPVA